MDSTKSWGGLVATTKLLQLICAFHNSMSVAVNFDGHLSKACSLKCGVKQRCVMVPTLFGIYISVLIYCSFPPLDHRALCTQRDGKLFNHICLKAKAKTNTVFILELIFSDDAVFCAQKESKLQVICDTFIASCDLLGLQISIQKTVVLSTSAPTPCIPINGKTHKEVDKFCYLGSVIDKSVNLVTEVAAHVRTVANIFGKLQIWPWNNRYLTMHTKIKIYDGCVLSSLLYSSEMWASHASIEHKLSAFHMQCLRKLVEISWKDKISNGKSLQHCGTMSLYAILKCHDLCYLGHMSCMTTDWLPKQTLKGNY